MVFPMVKAKHTSADVDEFWAGENFRLGIDGKLWGNCDLCFLKGRQRLTSLIASEPATADWWIAQEEHAHAHFGDRLRQKGLTRFNDRHSYEELRSTATKNRELMPYDGPDGVLPCLCTD